MAYSMATHALMSKSPQLIKLASLKEESPLLTFHKILIFFHSLKWNEMIQESKSLPQNVYFQNHPLAVTHYMYTKLLKVQLKT